jgi:hypothetical protein
MILWGLTAVIAGYEVFLARYIVTQLYFIALRKMDVSINVLERLSATGVGNIASLVMAIFAIGIVVGGFDYHWRYGGKKRSFKWLTITILFQAIFILLGFTL